MKNGYERVPSFKIAEFCFMFAAERERIVDKSPHLTSNLYFRVENTIFYFLALTLIKNSQTPVCS